MNLNDFHFLRPWWLLALPLLMLLWWRLRQTTARSSWENSCDPHLLPFIISDQASRGKRFSSVALATGIILAVVALAGPTWQRLPQPVFRQQSALVILLDLSRSMDCPDINPTRLSRARYKVADILRLRSEGQTALVVFAGTAFTVTPLTTDNNTIVALLNSLQSDIMPSQGSRVDLAIEKGQQLIEQAGLQQGDLLLIGDGAEGPRSLAAAQNLAVQGFRLSVLGVGTTEGAPIATGDGFLQDAQGNIVIPQIDEELLRDLARAGGGEYQRISIDDRDIETLLPAAGFNLRQNQRQPTELVTDRWYELGPWLLLPLLPLAALAFRRGYLMVFLFCLLLPGKSVQAAELTDLWSRPDQQAYRELQQGNAAAAAEKFTDPAWRAVANYRAGQFQQSVDALADLTDSTSLYNKGNALAQLGRYPEAIEAYEQTLATEPEHADARYNMELVQKLLQQNQPPQDQQKQATDDAGQDQSEQKNQRQQPADDSQDGGKAAENQPAEEQPPSDQKKNQAGAAEEEKAQSDQRSAESKQQQETSSAEQAERAGQPDEKTSDTPLPTTETDAELQQATERWLQQIPDDPGSLLQRKFLYQYRQQQQSGKENPW